MKDMKTEQMIESQINELMDLVCYQLDEVPDEIIQWSKNPDDKENAQIVYLAWLMETIRQESPKFLDGLSKFVEGC